MRTEDQDCAERHFFHRFDKDGAAQPELVHHVAVVNDFVVNVNGRSEEFQRALDDFDGANDTRTEAARADAHQFPLRFRLCRSSGHGFTHKLWIIHGLNGNSQG